MDQIVNYYDKLAPTYDQDRFDNTYGKFIDRQERNILNRLLKSTNETLLDLACGSGRLMDYADFGVDASEQMAQIAQQKYPSKKIYVADAEKLPFADKSVDTIISFHFFMHLDIDKVDKILRECDRVLSAGGRLIFDIPSSKRRRIISYRNKGWHGNFCLTNEQIKRLNPNFELKTSFGILFIPIHRIPKRIRHLFIKLDAVLSNSFLKEFSSYQIIELVKK